MSRVRLLLDTVRAHARAILIATIVALGSGCALWFMVLDKSVGFYTEKRTVAQAHSARGAR